MDQCNTQTVLGRKTLPCIYVLESRTELIQNVGIQRDSIILTPELRELDKFVFHGKI